MSLEAEIGRLADAAERIAEALERIADPHPVPDLLGEDAEVLRLGRHILPVTKAFPTWRTSARPPSVRGIRDAIDAYRKATLGPAAKFKSMQVAGEVAKAINRLREKPELLDLMKLQNDTN